MTYKGYLIDLDVEPFTRTVSLRGKPVIGTTEGQIPLSFVTNNSMRTLEMVQELLRNQCELETDLLETIYTATL